MVGWKRIRVRGRCSPQERHPGRGHPGCSVTVRTPEAMHICSGLGGFCPGSREAAGAQPPRRASASLTFTQQYEKLGPTRVSTASRLLQSEHRLRGSFCSEKASENKGTVNTGEGWRSTMVSLKITRV